jgi:DNA invertase Pin-like site-specific DNA recombinase
MKCFHCSSKNTRVTVTEHHGDQTKRYCRCLNCGKRYQTIEEYKEKKKPRFHRPMPRPDNAGSKNYKSYLTDDDIRKIRKWYDQGMRQRDIVKRTGISRYVIHLIVKRKTYLSVK